MAGNCVITGALHVYHCCAMLQEPIARKGGVEVVVEAARAHVDSVDVAVEACRAMAALAEAVVNKVRDL